jgi:hypothetical protein
MGKLVYSLFYVVKKGLLEGRAVKKGKSIVQIAQKNGRNEKNGKEIEQFKKEKTLKNMGILRSLSKFYVKKKAENFG